MFDETNYSHSDRKELTDFAHAKGTLATGALVHFDGENRSKIIESPHGIELGPAEHGRCQVVGPEDSEIRGAWIDLDELRDSFVTITSGT